MAAGGARAQPPVDRVPRAAIFERFGLPPDTSLLVGVERMDYTKGILDRFLALERLFERQPEWIGRMAFLQIAAPSRGNAAGLPAAAPGMHRASSTTINEQYGSGGYKPIIMLAEHHDAGRHLRTSIAPPMSASSAACTTA